ncbi:glycolate oxidase subunit GlcF [Microbulbifer sp.]|uniref:glycolate oxidase subunit GlcF n=1 Tax=Microbulbifer sp. TaxID=1908541 RepID=UPI003F33DA80
MQVKLLDGLLEESDAQRAEQVLNACVHCGFCTATCPTYLLAGNELDSPRGRIYLIKEMLETGSAGELTRTHLDRCVTCRSCETTCPSGVEYHKLVAIGRATSDRLAPRNVFQRGLRAALRKLMLSPRLFGGLLAAGRVASPLLPASLRRVYFPPRKRARPLPGKPVEARTAAVILLPGCVQPSLRPEIDTAFARILDFFGVPLLQPPAAGCCGAVSQHTSAEEEARELARRNVDCWWKLVQNREVRAIVSTATGCGAQLHDYPLLLADDPHYAARAQALNQLMRDPVELLEELLQEKPLRLPADALTGSFAFHCPCTLQHGLGLNGRVERLLAEFGLDLPPINDAHLCCGSAGTYSILQRKFSQALRRRKLANLQASEPQTILTANIGCLLHLQGGTETPVRHWLELLAEALPND